MKIKDKLDYSFNIIGNLGEFFRSAPTDVKIMLLGSIFPEKIQFDGKNYRTNSYNKMLDIIFQETNTLRGNKKLESSSNEEDSNSVPPDVLFSNELLEDLEKIWALRFVIPDPKNPKCTKEG